MNVLLLEDLKVDKRGRAMLSEGASEIVGLVSLGA